MKYIATCNHKKNLIMFKINLRFCVGPHSQLSWVAPLSDKCLKTFFLFLILTRGHAYWFVLGREGKRGRERGREASVWERNIDQLSLVCAPTRDEPATQAFALTGDRTWDFSVYRTTLRPTESPGQNENTSWFSFSFRGERRNIPARAAAPLWPAKTC